jgi:pimeloyl-ACP methyl ester carboxylesterase
MPADFRELSPSYRAIDPEGVRQWLELEHKAVPQRVNQGKTSKVTWAALKQMKVPTLLVTGDADLYTPPAVLKMFAAAIPNNEIAVIAEAGHSVYWEQPDEFNRLVLAFLKKHR